MDKYVIYGYERWGCISLVGEMLINMNSDFPRLITLLRKEKGLSQKKAAAELMVSQALLSHYEKGIRECGLEFLVKCADFYGVSCDFLLGRSPDRNGSILTVEDIPDPESVGKENLVKGASGLTGGMLTILNKKLITNSLNILFDLLGKTGSKGLVSEVSMFLMLAVYKAFRIVYFTNPQNQQGLFMVPKELSKGYSDGAMSIIEANAISLALGVGVENLEPVKSGDALLITTDSLTKSYPLFLSSLMNLIQNSENRILGKVSKRN